MNRSLAILVLTGWPLLATAQEIDRRIEAAPEGELEISNGMGEIIVEGWEQDEVHVTGELGQGVERLDVFAEGERVIVRVIQRESDSDRSAARQNWWGGGTDLRIQAPSGMSLDISTFGADVEARGMRGEQRITGISGDIETEAFSAEIRVESVSGDIRVDGRDSELLIRASAISGDVTLTNISGEVRGESVSGDLVLRGGTIERAEVKTVSGEIVILSELAPSARLEATATSGDVELEFRGAAAGDYRLETFSGVIANCFGPQPPPTDSRSGPPGRQLRFREGNTDARVEARTHSGDIRVCRE